MKSAKEASKSTANQKDKEAQVFVAPQWKLMWWKFRRHKLAVISAVVVILIYSITIIAEFLAPSLPDTTNAKLLYAPPQVVQIDNQGLFVNGYTSEIDPEALRRVFKLDPSQRIEVGFFVQGPSYKFLGIFDSDLHFMGPKEIGQPFLLLGADRLGRDLYSRLIYGTRISMSIGLLGVLFALILGITLGGISGYFGGTIDTIIQRVIEFLRSIPSIPLWMGLAAALPKDWDGMTVYFALTLILSLFGWTDMARVVRGRFLALREEDFVMAARLDGASKPRIIFRHMLPAFTSHIIASITLQIPSMILSETSLSFLGLGLREPIVSWGVLLEDSKTIRTIATAPWLLIPAIALIIAVLALNFLGDGLRDAADPYSR
jgi:peptide/nickel transport system permease protein